MTSAKLASNTSSTKSNVDATAKSPDLTLECLRVDHSVIAKELVKFRACEPVTRTLYCREWAQYIYKRHFAYNAKTQEEMSQLKTISGPGGYKLCVGGPSPDTREIASSVCTRISKQMESYFSDIQNCNNQQGEFLSKLLSECESWQKLPNSMSWLPDYFDPIVFDSFPDAIPLPDDPKDPSQLLDALIIDKTSLSLPSSCFHLLKNLNAEVLASQAQPICGHRKPMAKNPAELDIERKIFADKFEKVTNVVYTEIESLLLDVWKDLNTTLDGLKSLMADWRREMGPDLILVLSEFCRNNRDKLMGFNEYWSPYLETFKKKKSTTSVEDVDNAFYQYLDNIRDITRTFETEFMGPRYKSAIKLVQSLQGLCGDVLEKKMDDMKQHGVEKFHTAVLDSCSTARNFVLKPEHLESVQDNVETVQDKMAVVLKELYDELDSVKEQYDRESQKNVVGRLEKTAHKEFKKRVKKLESMQQSIRQTFASEFMSNVFPEQQFAQMALVTLISVMQEGEQMECDEMDDFMFDFVDENEELLAQRDDLILDYEEGVHTGRTQLAGLVGTLYLKEGMRIQGDSLALKRQNSLLKSMGITPDATEEASASPASSGSASKKKKKKKKNASSAATAESEPASVETPTVTQVPTPSSTAISKQPAKTNAATSKPATPASEAVQRLTQPQPVAPVPANAASRTKVVPAKEQIKAQETKKATEKAPTSSKMPASESPIVSTAASSKVVVEPLVSVKKPAANGSATSALSIATKQGASVVEHTPKPAVGAAKEQKPNTPNPVTNKTVPTSPKPVAEPVSKPADSSPVPGKLVSKANPLKQFKEAATIRPQVTEAAKVTPPPVPSPIATPAAPPVAVSAAANEAIVPDKSAENSWMTKPNMLLWGDSPKVPYAKTQSPSGVTGWGEPEQKPVPVTNNLWGQQPSSQPNASQSGWGDALESTASERSRQNLIQSGWGEPSHAPTILQEPKKTVLSSSSPAVSVISSTSQTKNSISDIIDDENESDPPLIFKLSSIFIDHEKASQDQSQHDNWDNVPSPESNIVKKDARPNAVEAPKIPPHLPPGLQLGNQLQNQLVNNPSVVPFDNMGPQQPNTLISLINNLQAENTQLVNALLSVQQELNTVNARYGELVTLAREREAQKSVEMEEARRYILKLEAKVHLLERTENSTSFEFTRRSNEPDSGHSHSHANDNFGGHGRSDKYQRQPLSKPRHQSSFSNSDNQDRDRRRNMWRDSRAIKCGNCGESGHKSSECQVWPIGLLFTDECLKDSLTFRMS